VRDVLALIGFRDMVNEVVLGILDPLPLNTTSKVETVHPLCSYGTRVRDPQPCLHLSSASAVGGHALDVYRRRIWRMRRLLMAVLLCAAPLTLSACGDGTPPSKDDINNALSSVASQGSDAASSLTAGPSKSPSVAPSASRTNEQTAAPTPTPTPTLTRTETATETAVATETATETATATSTVTKTPKPPKTESPTATPGTEPAASETSVNPWVWALIGLLVVVLVVSLVMLARRRAATKRWDADFAAASGSAQWINDTYVPSVLALGSASQIEQSWQEGTARINDVDTQLFQLEPQAPDANRATSVAGVRTSLAALRQALQRVVDLAVAGADGDSQRQAAASVQEARTALSAALTGLTAQHHR